MAILGVFEKTITGDVLAHLLSFVLDIASFCTLSVVSHQFIFAVTCKQAWKGKHLYFARTQLTSKVWSRCWRMWSQAAAFHLLYTQHDVIGLPEVPRYFTWQWGIWTEAAVRCGWHWLQRRRAVLYNSWWSCLSATPIPPDVRLAVLHLRQPSTIALGWTSATSLPQLLRVAVELTPKQAEDAHIYTVCTLLHCHRSFAEIRLGDEVRVIRAWTPGCARTRSGALVVEGGSTFDIALNCDVSTNRMCISCNGQDLELGCPVPMAAEMNWQPGALAVNRFFLLSQTYDMPLVRIWPKEVPEQASDVAS